ncbi:MAG: hypothetical protein U5M23_15905 [Marinagarivorans sp.]|nr:hypothetical protein [Marinagarivorans sp.]
MEQAVKARQEGLNVLGDRKQVANQIETKAFGKEAQMQHKGHDLGDGTTGKPHFQTEGKHGHTFWSILSVVAIATADALDKVATAAEYIDPTSYLLSGGPGESDNSGSNQNKDNKNQKNNDGGSNQAGIYNGYIVCDGKFVICKVTVQ